MRKCWWQPSRKKSTDSFILSGLNPYLMKLFLSVIFVFCTCLCHAQEKYTLPELKDSIKKILDDEHIPGLMVALVTKDSIIWAGGIGLANIESKTKVNENTLFRIGSITKSFTALAILKLIEQGKFALDSKLADLAPEIPFTNKWEKESPVRIINLLEHTAGFDDMHFAAFLDKDKKRKSTLNQALAHVNALHSRWRPGTRMAYSNPGYAILGYIIEKYSGVKYEEFIDQTIFRPLKMTHSNFEYYTKEPYAMGYSFSDGSYHQALPVKPNGNSAGGLSSCAKDLANFVRFYLNDGRFNNIQILSKESVSEMEHTHSTLAAQHGLKAGYGLANSTKMIGDGKVKEIFRGKRKKARINKELEPVEMVPVKGKKSKNK